MIDHKGAKILDLRRQIRMAERRLGMINFELGKRHDAALAGEADALVTQIATLEANLETLEAEAA